jgi:WD40 repeat protein
LTTEIDEQIRAEFNSAPHPPRRFLTTLSDDARQCIYERLSRRDLRALACTCKDLSAEVPVVVASLHSRGHVFCAPHEPRPKLVRCLKFPAAGGLELAFSRGDGALLAALTYNGAIHVLDSASGAYDVVWKRPAPLEGVWRCAFTRDNSLLAIATDVDLQLLSAADGSVLRTLEGHPAKIMSIACSPVADTLLSSDIRGFVKLWDLNAGQELHAVPSDGRSVSSVAVDVSGTLAATGASTGVIRLSDMRAPYQHLHAFHAHRSDIWSLRFGTAACAWQLASASPDSTAKLWDLRYIDTCAPQCLHTLSGHPGAVQTVAFSPDDALLATGTTSSTVRLWSTASGKLQAELYSGGNPQVTSAVFHPRDASVLLTSHPVDGVKLWQL